MSRPSPRQSFREGWPVLAGIVVTAASCAMLNAPPDMSADVNTDALYKVGNFGEPDGDITEGGTMSGSWAGTCEIYGYPYQLELNLFDDAGVVTGDGLWITGWGTWEADVEGTSTPGAVELLFAVDYYGYPMNIFLTAELDGAGLVGECQYSYGSRGVLTLNRM